ncbi:unnamed protein product [Bubo scandiacus]
MHPRKQPSVASDGSASELGSTQARVALNMSVFAMEHQEASEFLQAPMLLPEHPNLCPLCKPPTSLCRDGTVRSETKHKRWERRCRAGPASSQRRFRATGLCYGSSSSSDPGAASRMLHA